MHTTAGTGQPIPPSVDLVRSSVSPPLFATQAGATIVPQMNGLPCGSCGNLPAAIGSGAVDTAAGPVELSYVYAVGQIEARFPSLGLEKEFAQVAVPSLPNDPSDPRVLERLLSDNRYLVRQLCWVLTIEDQPAYILRPHDPRGYDMLLDAVRVLASVSPETKTMERRDAAMNVVIGVAGPPAPPDLCNGLQAPMAVFDQIYSLTQDDLIQTGRDPEVRRQLQDPRLRLPEAAREPVAERSGVNLASDISYLLQAVDNPGRTPEHRALNFVITREPTVNALTARLAGGEFELTGLVAKPSRLSLIAEGREIWDVILNFRSSAPGVPLAWFYRVDVGGEFPFLVTSLQPYYYRD